MPDLIYSYGVMPLFLLLALAGAVSLAVLGRDLLTGRRSHYRHAAWRRHVYQGAPGQAVWLALTPAIWFLRNAWPVESPVLDWFMALALTCSGVMLLFGWLDTHWTPARAWLSGRRG